jgi:cyclopropane fatty-acyl-phospholipid synthase-like methyltransferase
MSESASILELGCGRGSLLHGLRKTGWAGSYCGVDMSKQAIHDARKCADQRSSWIISNFESFRSPFMWDIIAMIESIYYVKLREIPIFLNGVMGMLTESGVVLIRFHDFNKHQKYVEAVQGFYTDTKRVSPNLLCVGRSMREPVTEPQPR